MTATNDPPNQANIPQPRRWGILLLFTTSTTLVCCVLPLVLVSLGLGSAMAALASNVPILVTLSQHKLIVFVATGIVLVMAAWALYRPGRACPTDPELAALCERADRWNRRFLWVAVAMWAIGFAAAYLALPLVRWLEG